MDSQSVIAAIIALFAAIIGGIISLALFLLNPSIQLKSKRKELLFEAMDWSCGALLYYITNPTKLFDEESTCDIQEIQDNIYLYGTKNEIKVLSFIKSTIFTMTKDEMKDTYYSLAGSCLLLNVIRHETYGHDILSDYIFKVYIKDYYNVKPVLDRTYNRLVDALRLNRKYRIE